MDASDSIEEKPKLKPSLSGGGGDGEAPCPEKGTVSELDDLTVLGYKPELHRNRSMLTLLFQSLAIAAVRVHQPHHHVHDPPRTIR